VRAASDVGAGLADHLGAVRRVLAQLDLEVPRLRTWGRHLATVLSGGGRLLVAGNGGSAAQAQHLSSELSGRFRHDRMPLSALALHCDASAVTAISNDYGYDEVFARQVRAHGRPGDVLLALSTSGRSPNLLAAAADAGRVGMARWALTGPLPNPLADAVDDVVAVEVGDPAAVQDGHQVAVHLLATAIEEHLPPEAGPGGPHP
jgi:D-sedoheptulose 7-phosphate isomerase